MKKRPAVLVSLGRRVRELRKRREMTQQQLAERAGMNTKFLGELENGHRDLRVMTISRLAKSLGVELADIFHFNEVDETVAELERRLQGRDEAVRVHVLRLANEALMILDTGR